MLPQLGRTAQIPRSVMYYLPGNRMKPSIRVFVDFDGTLVVPNVAILLVEKFARGGDIVAHQVDLQLHAGEITLRQAWERQAALLPPDRIDEMTRWAVDNVPLRAGAREFLALLERNHIPTAVVSGGLDFYIRAVLDRESLSVPFVSDTLAVNRAGQLTVEHPYGHATCRLCGICKAQVVRSPIAPADRTIFLGDGSTDRYGAEVADVVFARHRLKTYCETNGIPFFPFEDFETVIERFQRWVDGSEPVPARRAIGRRDSPCPISDALALAELPNPRPPASSTDGYLTNPGSLGGPVFDRSGRMTR
jgi:2-hydroxy-3-keto-5-methylthiopentenyl-1-phosphate phosphatase